MTEDELYTVMNLGLNLSGFLDGDATKSMPVTEEEWALCKRWEREFGADGELTHWMHLRVPYDSHVRNGE